MPACRQNTAQLLIQSPRLIFPRRLDLQRLRGAKARCLYLRNPAAGGRRESTSIPDRTPTGWFQSLSREPVEFQPFCRTAWGLDVPQVQDHLFCPESGLWQARRNIAHGGHVGFEHLSSTTQTETRFASSMACQFSSELSCAVTMRRLMPPCDVFTVFQVQLSKA